MKTKVYLLTSQEGYSLTFYLLNEEDKNKKSLNELNINSVKSFKSMNNLIKYINQNNLELGKEEYLLYDSDISLSSN